jgi:hypothetical protein
LIAGSSESAKDREGIVIKNRNENAIDSIRAKLPWICIDGRSLEVTRALPDHYRSVICLSCSLLMRFRAFLQ